MYRYITIFCFAYLIAAASFAQKVYIDPFGSYLQGQRQAQEDNLRDAEARQQQRMLDLQIQQQQELERQRQTAVPPGNELPRPSAFAQWKFIGSNENNVKFFYDQESIQREGKERIIFVRIEDNKNPGAIVSRNRLHCDQRRVIEEYNLKFNISGEFIGGFIIKEKIPQSIEAGSIGYSIWQDVCTTTAQTTKKENKHGKSK